MIKLKSLINEALFGQKMYIIIKDQFGKELKIQSLLCKNTAHDYTYVTGYREDEYRISLFNRDRSESIGHVHFSKKTLNYILRTKQLTPKLKQQFSDKFHCKPSDIKLEFVNNF